MNEAIVTRQEMLQCLALGKQAFPAFRNIAQSRGISYDPDLIIWTQFHKNGSIVLTNVPGKKKA
jgi:hypothetical protein